MNAFIGPALEDYLRPVWTRRWPILAVVLVATAATYGYFSRQASVYQATTSIFVQSASPVGVVNGPVIAGTDRNTSNQAALVQSRDVAELVAKRLKYKGDPGALRSQIAVTAKPGSDFVQVSGKASDPKQAARLANAFARAFIDLRSDDRRKTLGRALASAKQRLDEAPRGPSGAAQRSNLQQQIEDLQLSLSVSAGTAQQVDPAQPPGQRASPRPVRDAVFACVFSLLLAVVAAFGLERLDRRLRTPEAAEEAYSMPLLAVVPHTEQAAARNDDKAALGSDLSETFRALRTNIKLLTERGPKLTLLVTSAIPGEGKSTVVRNLALAFRELGNTVAVVDADLRKPTMARLFGVETDGGLTEVLVGERTLEEARRHVPVDAPGVETLARITGQNGTSEHQDVPRSAEPDTLSLLASGRPVANPAAVLATDRMKALLEQVAASHDVVLIDSPPLLAVTDTVPLMSQVDGVVIVHRLGLTKRGAVRRLLALLNRVDGATVVGLIANDRSRFEGFTQYDYYGRGYVQRDRAQ